MENMEKKIKEVLLDEAKKVYKEEVEKNSSQTTFSNNEVIDIELHDLKNHAYMFVLGCVMDRQIKAERAWEIPHKVCAHLNVNNFQDLVALTESDIVDYLSLQTFIGMLKQWVFAFIKRFSVFMKFIMMMQVKFGVMIQVVHR